MDTATKLSDFIKQDPDEIVKSMVVVEPSPLVEMDKIKAALKAQDLSAVKLRDEFDIDGTKVVVVGVLPSTGRVFFKNTVTDQKFSLSFSSNDCAFNKGDLVKVIDSEPDLTYKIFRVNRSCRQVLLSPVSKDSQDITFQDSSKNLLTIRWDKVQKIVD